MKKTYSYFVLFFNISASLIASESMTQKTIDQEIAALDATISEKYSGNVLIILFGLTEDQYLDILTMAKDNADSTFSIKELSKKNNYFSQAISHFIKLATQNYERVTANTLQTVTNPLEPQPIGLLNLIPLPIKTYAMIKAKVHKEQDSFNFYLCKQAIKNTHNTTFLETIPQSQPYSQLADSEQKSIHQLMERRSKEIS